MAVTDNKDVAVAIRAAHPICITTYVDDNSTGSFTLGYLPSTSDETGGATNSITSNGTETAVTSVSTSTGVVTQVAAGTAGDIWVVAYETEYASA